MDRLRVEPVTSRLRVRYSAFLYLEPMQGFKVEGVTSIGERDVFSKAIIRLEGKEQLGVISVYVVIERQ